MSINWESRRFMTKNIPLTLACGDYESIRALKEGSVKVDGVDLTVLTDMDSASRHWRMLRGGEFDIAELSMSSYLMAADRKQPFKAIPVFLHRRFRHGFIFINKDKGIEKPSDLIGRKVGGTTFAPASNVWIRGILEDEYGVPFKDMIYFTDRDDDIDFEIAEGLRIERIPETKSLDAMLVDGEIDAMISPSFPKPYLDGNPKIGRLFENYKEVEAEYFRNTGIFPIMHVNTIRREIVEKYPWVPGCLVEAFEKSKNMAYERVQNPRIVPLAWYRRYLDREREILGPDAWEYGLGDANRKNLETAIMYSHDCGLISQRLSPDEIFLNPTSGRGRGGKRI